MTSYSYDQAGAQIIRHGYTWALPTNRQITYAYVDNPNDNYEFTAGQIAVMEGIIGRIEQIANIDFVRVNPTGYSDQATILIHGAYDNSAGASGGWARGALNGGDYSFSSDQGDMWINQYNASANWLAFTHEFLHTIGLEHPGDYNGTANYSTDAVYIEDNRQFTAMSYFSPTYSGGSFFVADITSPQLHDISALHQAYGAHAKDTGNTTYSLTAVPLAIWDTGGTDTLSATAYAGTQTLDLRALEFSSTSGSTHNVSIAKGVVIENASGGSGADTIIGNTSANILTGNGGNDVLQGGAGNDQLYGNAGADTLLGEQGTDYLFGGSENDQLAGGTDYGVFDWMDGGAGNDTFFFQGGRKEAHDSGGGNDYYDFDIGFAETDIYDFQAGSGVGDQIALVASMGIANFSELQNNTSAFYEEVDANGITNTAIRYSPGTYILLHGHHKADFASDDFLFT